MKTVYTVLKKIKVFANNGNYRPLSHGFKLLFLRITSPKKLEKGVTNIPVHEFKFIRPDMIKVRINDKDIFSGIFFPYKILLNIYVCIYIYIYLHDLKFHVLYIILFYLYLYRCCWLLDVRG